MVAGASDCPMFGQQLGPLRVLTADPPSFWRDDSSHPAGMRFADPLIAERGPNDFRNLTRERKSAMYSNTLILVAGGDPADRETILQALGDEFHVVASQTTEDALAHANDSIGLVICDLESSQFDALQLVQSWKRRQPGTPFLALIHGRDVTSAVEAMKHGVSDCLVKPVD